MRQLVRHKRVGNRAKERNRIYVAICLSFFFVYMGFAMSFAEESALSSPSAPSASPTPEKKEASHQNISQETLAFFKKLNTLTWITYAPTHYNPEQGKDPTVEDMRADLEILKKYGFDGIITYSSQYALQQIPHLAHEQGFKGVIMGVWDPSDVKEIHNALQEVAYVDAYVVGNEGYQKRYSREELLRAMDTIKTKTGKPVSTTEQINEYYNSNKNLIGIGDWVFPNVHPFFYNITKPAEAVHWTEVQYTRLARAAKGKPVFFKEVGLPTSGHWQCSESDQAAYYDLLRQTNVLFAYFEAFDQPWKHWVSVEPYWGLFQSDRTPKQYMHEKGKRIGIEARRNMYRSFVYMRQRVNTYATSRCLVAQHY